MYLKLLNLYNIQACHQAKSENENDEELDEIAKLSTNKSKLHRKKILKCSASLCLVSQSDSAPEWVPDLDFKHIKHMPSYECLNCQSYSTQDVSKHTDHQLEHLQMVKHSWDVEILVLSNICKKYSQDQENSMG